MVKKEIKPAEPSAQVKFTQSGKGLKQHMYKVYNHLTLIHVTDPEVCTVHMTGSIIFRITCSWGLSSVHYFRKDATKTDM
jgi:hypothetical protein